MARTRANGRRTGAAPGGARPRRRAGSLADFLAQPEEGYTAREDVQEVVFEPAGQEAPHRHDGARDWARIREYLRDELAADPEGFLLKAFSSLGEAIVRFLRFFGSFSRYLLLPLSVLILLTGITVASACTVGLRVTVDGVDLGVVSDAGVYETAKAAVEESYSERLGEAFAMEQAPVYTLSLVSRGEVVSEQALQENISRICEEAAGRSWGLFVDGELVGTYTSENAIYEMLEAIKKPYESGLTGEAAVFMNEVKVERDIYPDSFSMSIAQLRAKLLCGGSAVQYSSAEGDTAESICEAFGLSSTVLHLLNPSVNFDGLPAGTILTVGDNTPLLSVQVSRTIVYEEAIPFNTVSSESADLWDGSVQIISAGVEGARQVTAQVVVVDGVEISRVISSEVVLREPVTQYQLVGTKPISATGRFIWPIAGYGIITSDFGAWRGDHYHMGIDIAANSGTDIFACDAGVVTVAGWSDGGYGYNVEIDHGNGIKTRYSHCREVYVSVGQIVYQGQTVAAVGSSGWSTGPHCHFSLEVDGSYVNPHYYIS